MNEKQQMEKKQVSEVQIEQLFKFMRQKYVRYYDVQIELVDHFASAIEAMWEKSPTMTFEQGIDNVYVEFPITGFNDLINEKTVILNKKILSYAWKEMKLYLQFPKIMLTLLLTTLLYLLFSNVQQPMIYVYIIWLITFLGSTYLITQLRNIGSKKQQFLVLNTLLGFQSISLFICTVPPPPQGLDNLSFWSTIGLSILTVFMMIFCIGHYKVARSIFEEWKTQYPQFV